MKESRARPRLRPGDLEPSPTVSDVGLTLDFSAVTQLIPFLLKWFRLDFMILENKTVTSAREKPLGHFQRSRGRVGAVAEQGKREGLKSDNLGMGSHLVPPLTLQSGWYYLQFTDEDTETQEG